MKKYIFLIFLLFSFFSYSQKINRPLPTNAQINWHNMEFYLFMHFGPNTFTQKEWGEGNEKENIFNPTKLNCNQWCSIAKAAGAKGIIITAKHHDGFCLWPSKFSTHTVKQSKWKNGKGDVLKELSTACKKYGLKFGVYISPWDRNHPSYGSQKYNDVFIQMMKEIFNHYGPIWELWWDGANGEVNKEKHQQYDWVRFEQTVRKLSPNTIIFSDIGPDARWVGNENGFANKNNWNYFDTIGFTRGKGGPPENILQEGISSGRNWIPAECDVSIRPGWFYHANENEFVKQPNQLFNLYLKSVGLGANLLLNVPPNELGLISAPDSIALIGFKKLLSKNFYGTEIKYKNNPIIKNSKHIKDKNNFTLSQSNFNNKNELHFFFTKKQAVNCIVLKENLHFGQRIKNFTIQLITDTGTVNFMGNTVGHKRMITFSTTSTNHIIIQFNNLFGDTKIFPVLFYKIEDSLIFDNAKAIQVKQ